MDWGFLINMGVGAVLKHTKLGKTKSGKPRTVPNWMIPVINFVGTTAVSMATGQDFGASISLGATNTFMATGVHSAIKNPVKAWSGRSI